MPGRVRVVTAMATAAVLAACGSPTTSSSTTSSSTAVTSPPTTASSLPGSSTTAPAPTSTTLVPSTPATEIALYDGVIVTMDPALPEAEAVLIRDGVVALVGTADEVLAATGPRAARVDLGGLVVFPGFIDSHTHRLTQRWKWGFETIEQAADRALSEGWVGLTELAVGPDDFASLREAAEQGRLPIRVNAYLTVNGFAGEELDDWYHEFEPGQEFGPNLRIAGLKIFIDFDSGRTLLWEADDLERFVADRRAEGWQITVKAISLQSHDLALAAFEPALADGADHRFRIEHSIAVTDEHLQRMADGGIIASIQPSFPAVVWYDEDIRNLTDEMGRSQMFRWPDYVAAGVRLAGSPYNPDGAHDELTESSHVSVMGLLYRSATQVGLGGTAPESWMLGRRLDRDVLLRMLTAGGAYATFEEESRGALSPGMRADLVVLSDDPRTVEAEALLEVRVLMALLKGEVAWCSDEAVDLCARVAAGASPEPGSGVTASAWLDEEPPANAFDGSVETAWNSGQDPEQRIQVAFSEPRTISVIRLVVAQSPAGAVTHQIWAGPSPDRLTLVHEFVGSLADGDIVEIVLDTPFTEASVVRIVTTESPSWVAWREIEL